MGIDNQSVRPDDGRSDDGSLLLLIFLLVLTLPAAYLVNTRVPGGYMDEEFHLNQVEHYCRGDFSYWDPKITTFPGLYLASLVYGELLLPGADYFGYGSTLGEICKPAVLRSVNLLLFGICAMLFREIAIHLDPERNPIRATLKAFVLSLYPLHWFFTLLYYTEMGSATAVMAMYLATLKRSYWSSAMFGVGAILFRQTNVVWVFFVLVVGVVNFLDNVTPLRGELDHPAESDEQARGLDEDNENEQTSSLNEPLRDGLRQRQFGRLNLNSGPNVELTATSFDSPIHCDSMVAEATTLVKHATIQRNALLWNFSPFLVVLLAFIGFVVKNGSVVVGDKNAHKVSPHFAQILYCGLICAAFQAPAHFNTHRIKYLLGVLKQQAVGALGTGLILAATFAVIAVKYYSAPHPYLLADNRHFTFYIWKDVIQRHWMLKYLAIPVYLYSWSSILSSLAEKQKPLWIVAFFLAVAGVVVPTPLLEFRYYNIPFYFIFLHISITSSRKRNSRLFFTPVQFMCINYLTVYIFLNWTFQWSNQPGVAQRFMW
ncbi:hypothetical protein Mapa_015549 [Marchantia paleacea]|nr:hypothetical protein Mapa_015549 [Marchantia paleacea]